MDQDLELHHFSKRISKGTLEFVLEMFSQLNCKLFYRKGDSRWALVQPIEKDIKIQIIESDLEPLSTEKKKNSHIGFISSDPEKEIQKMKVWIENKNKKFVTGSWSDKEFYFDCPEVFVDFVIEIMNKSILND